jgi:hypothetical protein
VVLGAGKGNADVQQVLGFRQTTNSDDLPKWRIQVRARSHAFRVPHPLSGAGSELGETSVHRSRRSCWCGVVGEG